MFFSPKDVVKNEDISLDFCQTPRFFIFLKNRCLVSFFSGITCKDDLVGAHKSDIFDKNHQKMKKSVQKKHFFLLKNEIYERSTKFYMKYYYYVFCTQNKLW